MNPANKVATPHTVVEYLVAAYEVDEAAAKQLVAEHEEAIRKASVFGSHAYYVGNEIATSASLEENVNYDPDEEDEDDDDDGDCL